MRLRLGLLQRKILFRRLANLFWRKKFGTFCLLQRKILFRRFSDFFRRLSDFFRRLVMTIPKYFRLLTIWPYWCSSIEFTFVALLARRTTAYFHAMHSVRIHNLYVRISISTNPFLLCKLKNYNIRISISTNSFQICK